MRVAARALAFQRGLRGKPVFLNQHVHFGVGDTVAPVVLRHALAQIFAVGGIQLFVAEGAQLVGVGIEVGQIAQVLLALAGQRDGDVGERGAIVGMVGFLATAQRVEIALPIVVAQGGRLRRGGGAKIVVFA